MTFELGIIGAGNMAEAIAAGVLSAGVLHGEQIIASNHNADRLGEFAKRLGGLATTSDNRQVAAQSRVVLLCVKPAKLGEVLREIAPAAHHDAIYVSVAAGITTRFIESQLGAAANWRAIRTMPNTPMAVGEGAVGLARGAFATDADVLATRRLLESCADVIEVPEDKIDAVTAVSGSGPAYFFFMVEQMTRAGVELGLTEPQARSLAAKTALGAGKMLVAQPGVSAAELRRRVTSPNGTTHAAITALQAAGFEEAIVSAVKAAAKRAKELAV
ncbi:MAG TPA: pyrroline-5-carboxylate reductase [Tepidisphaeraceae bacterium]|jgi:pyrroline-5-carboxylate reductase|nr:pyrroline-5-carboxylate reductase [Tepidisphaeraceae bacterium]